MKFVLLSFRVSLIHREHSVLVIQFTRKRERWDTKKLWEWNYDYKNFMHDVHRALWPTEKMCFSSFHEVCESCNFSREELQVRINIRESHICGEWVTSTKTRCEVMISHIFCTAPVWAAMKKKTIPARSEMISILSNNCVCFCSRAIIFLC